MSESKMNSIKDAFKRKHKESLIKKISRKRIIKLEDSRSHWYNCIDDIEFNQVINNTRQFANEYITKVNGNETLPNKIKYNELLKIKVNSFEFKRRVIETKKLQRLPKYDPFKKELYGSAFTFYALWCHVFSNKR